MGRYSIGETLRNVVALAITRITWPGARLVRRPFFVRGRRHIQVGPGLTTGYGCRFDLGGIRTRWCDPECRPGLPHR